MEWLSKRILIRQKKRGGSVFQPFFGPIKGIARLVLNTNFVVSLNLPDQSESKIRFLHWKKNLHEELIDQKLKINLNRCVRCGKCVKVCAEIRKVGALRHPVLSPEVDKIVFDRTCEMCGQCAVVCPTGAIIEIYREKPDRRVRSVCTYCGTGCGIFHRCKGRKDNWDYNGRS